MPCPSELQLEGYVAGSLSVDETDSISRHATDCPTCARWLEEEAADQDLLTAVRHAVRSHDSSPEPLAIPEHLGDYHVMREIGAGSMGIVYEAEQDHPRRRVALKVVRSGLASARLLRRFENEAQVLGLLSHPGIAQIHAAGTFETPQGRQPYLAMELVDGLRLTDWVAAMQPDRDTVLALFAELCRAVHHAHQKGVIHRDLKPGNILVDKEGRPKVLDFGIARLGEADARVATMQTHAGQLLGTVPYMSPEQVVGDPTGIDVRSDVYALGVLLYEMLTGKLPHNLLDKSVPEALRMISEDEPIPLGQHDPSLPNDLATISQKALAKERDHRYGSADELAREVERFLRHEPIEARPPSALYQLRKFARRNRVLVGSTTVLMVVLVAALVVVSSLLSYARHKQKAAEAQAEQATAARDFLQEVIVQASPNEHGQSEPSIQDVFRKALEMVDNLVGQPAVEASVRHTLGRVQEGLGRYDEAERQLARAVELLLQVEPVNGSRLANVLTHLAGMRVQAGNLEGANEAIKRALTYRDAIERHPRLLGVALLVRAQCSEAMGRPRDAVPDYRAAMVAYQQAEGQDSPNVTIAMCSLGTVLADLGQDEEGERLLRQSLARDRASGRAVGIRTALGRLHMFLRNRDQFDEAERLLRESIVIGKEKLGAQHPDVAFDIRDLGSLLCRKRDFAGGIALIREGMAIQERVLGKDHARVGQSSHELGLALIHSERPAEAEPALRRAVDLLTPFLGPGHRLVLGARSSLGESLFEQHRFDEATEVLTGVREQIRKHHPDDERWHTQAIAKLAACLYAAGEAMRARQLGGASLIETWIPTGKGRVWVRTGGAGPDVVMLHDAGADGGVWAGLVPSIRAAGFRVTTIDAVGAGRSERRPDLDRSLASACERLVATCDALGIAQAHVVGHGRGAEAARRLMLHHPDRVERLVLLVPKSPSVPLDAGQNVLVLPTAPGDTKAAQIAEFLR